MKDGFRQRLRAGEKLIGTMVTVTSAMVAEVLSGIGFDWLFIDGEHGPLETAELQAIMQAVGDDIACLVRVPTLSEIPIKKTLDLGATGIIVPQVNTAEEAATVVQFSRYAPQGSRGVGLARANGYGSKFQEYMASANDDVVVVVQAEHALAVENIESIVQVAGVDAVLIGPYDLSASLGRMGQLDDPVVVEAIEHVTQTCRAAAMPLGMFGFSADAVRPYVDKGYNLIVVGVDTTLLSAAAGQMLGELRERG